MCVDTSERVTDIFMPALPLFNCLLDREVKAMSVLLVCVSE